MPTFNPDILRQLLDSFVEQEQLVAKEMQVIDQQIQELEAKIKQCRARIESVADDRDKINLMQQRYANGRQEVPLAEAGKSKESTRDMTAAGKAGFISQRRSDLVKTGASPAADKKGHPGQRQAAAAGIKKEPAGKDIRAKAGPSPEQPPEQAKPAPLKVKAEPQPKPKAEAEPEPELQQAELKAQPELPLPTQAQGQPDLQAQQELPLKEKPEAEEETKSEEPDEESLKKINDALKNLFR